MPGEIVDTKKPDALAYCEEKRLHFERKADHNKNESQWCFIAVIVCTLAAPVFVTLGDGWVWAKLVPSVLSLVAAAATAWLQLRKPQQQWANYRDAQRRIEQAHTHYTYQIGAYAMGDREKRLALAVSDVCIDAHEKWMPNVPNADRLPSLQAEAARPPVARAKADGAQDA